MDCSGRVNGVYKRLKVFKQAAEIRREPPPLPGRGPYRVVVADPPWPYEIRTEDPSHRATYSYPQMSVEQIRAMGSDVACLAHDDCILRLWTTNLHLRVAYAVLDAWGFEEKTILTWDNECFDTGDWLRGHTEHCIMATRGRPAVELTNQSTVLSCPATQPRPALRSIMCTRFSATGPTPLPDGWRTAFKGRKTKLITRSFWEGAKASAKTLWCQAGRRPLELFRSLTKAGDRPL
jgi:hypothetical protein